MSAVKVSIIIPAFNVELYVRQAIESIINQTLKEIEVIIIDDGSRDSTLSVIKEIAELDSRVKILSTPNNGQSVARNIGMYHATGEYLYFFDSDDLLESTALEECYKKSKLLNLDICFFYSSMFSEDGTSYSQYKLRKEDLFKEGVYTGQYILDIQLKNSNFSCSPCVNFINRLYLRKLNLSFYPGIIHEDELFTFILYLNAERISFIQERFFKRRWRINSTMTSVFSQRNAFGYLTVCRELYKYSIGLYNKTDYRDLCYKHLNMLLNTLYISVIKYLPKEDAIRYKELILKEFSGILYLKGILYIKYNFIYRFFKNLKIAPGKLKSLLVIFLGKYFPKQLTSYLYYRIFKKKLSWKNPRSLN